MISLTEFYLSDKSKQTQMIIDSNTEIERKNTYISFYEDLSKKQNKEIEKLIKGYCPIKEKCNKGECDCTNEEYNQMCEENIKLDLEIERLSKEVTKYDEILCERNNEVDRLNNIINKIKECLSKNRVYIHGERNLAFELDEILKGDDKSE